MNFFLNFSHIFFIQFNDIWKRFLERKKVSKYINKIFSGVVEKERKIYKDFPTTAFQLLLCFVVRSASKFCKIGHKSFFLFRRFERTKEMNENLIIRRSPALNGERVPTITRLATM